MITNKSTKNAGPFENMGFYGKRLKISDLKYQKFQSSHGEQNEGTTKPQGQKLNMNHVARKK